MSSKIELDMLAGYCQNGFGLNLGCGDKKLGKAIGVDWRPSAKAADMIMDVSKKLPFASNSLDFMVAAACLEHMPVAPVIVLREWVRCLRIGGYLAVTVPDATYGMWAITGDDGTVGKFIHGEHANLFTVDTLKILFEFIGMEGVRCESVSREPLRKELVILCAGFKTGIYNEDC